MTRSKWLLARLDRLPAVARGAGSRYLILLFICRPGAEAAGVEVHFIVASCENMVAGKGLRPGDVLTASNGKTIEVNNTDAEGRLTLADALVYAEKQVIIAHPRRRHVCRQRVWQTKPCVGRPKRRDKGAEVDVECHALSTFGILAFAFLPIIYSTLFSTLTLEAGRASEGWCLSVGHRSACFVHGLKGLVPFVQCFSHLCCSSTRRART